MALQLRKMGWVRDIPDHRDLHFSAPLAQLKALPRSVDLRPNFDDMPPYNQGRIGSCTANAIAAAVQYARQAAKETPDFAPSRMFIYYNERKAEKTLPFDAGAMIRTGMKSVNHLGVCRETVWPYDDTPADENTHLFAETSPAIKEPSRAAYVEANDFRVISYSRVLQSLAQMKGCLASNYPFTVGFSLYESFYDAGGRPKTAVPLPGGSDSILGGHAVLAVGYDDATQQFTLRNSWGTAVQDKGYFFMPYSYLTEPNLSSDFWTVRAVAA